MLTNTLIFFVVIAFGFTSADRSSSEVRALEEKKLAKSLLHRYDEVGRIGQPTFGGHGIVKVLFRLYPFQFFLKEGDSVEGTATVVMKWRDPLLKWNPEKYDGLDSVFLPIRSIWHPTLQVYEDNYSDFAQIYPSMDVVDTDVFPDGKVVWYPIMHFRALCKKSNSAEKSESSSESKEHGTYLHCTFTFGDFVRTTTKMHMYFDDNFKDADLSKYVQTPGFKIVRHWAEKRNDAFTFPLKKSEFSTLVYYFVFKKTEA